MCYDEGEKIETTSVPADTPVGVRYSTANRLITDFAVGEGTEPSIDSGATNSIVSVAEANDISVSTNRSGYITQETVG